MSERDAASLRRLDAAAPGFDARARGAHRVRGGAGSRGRRDRRADRRRRARARRRGAARIHGANSTASRRRRWPRSRSPPTRCARAFAALPEATRAALQTAAARIRAYHERQKLASWSLPRRRRQRIRPARDAARPRRHLRAGRQGGVSVVGADERHSGAGRRRGRDRHGRAHARTARAIRWCSPPRISPASRAPSRSAARRRSRRSPTARRRFPPVDKICGPGNAYVAAAKRRVFGAVGIDMIAGVSEVLVIADATRERRTGSRWTSSRRPSTTSSRRRSCVTPDAALLDAVAASAQRQIAEMPRRAIIAASLADRGALIKVRDLDEACAIANRVAPEHLELAVADPARAAAEDPPCRRDLHGAPRVGGARRLLRRARTTCCRPAAPRASRRRSASTISRSARACSASRSPAARALGPVAATLARRRRPAPRTRRARCYRVPRHERP